MTSKQVMLTAIALLLGGCAMLEDWFGPKPAESLVSPYATRQIWAVAPLRNESGTLQVDGAAMGDHLAHQLENASNLDVLPVNRTLEAMAALQMAQVATPGDAHRLLEALGCDGLVIGTVTAYDPYDPPKLGMVIELYANPAGQYPRGALDPARLSTAATADAVLPGMPGGGGLPGTPAGPGLPGAPVWQLVVPERSMSLPGATRGFDLGFHPVSVVSAFFDGGDPHTRDMMQAYAVKRGPAADDPNAWRRYRLSMDLFSEFASYVMSWRLLRAETQRLAPPVTQPAH